MLRLFPPQTTFSWAVLIAISLAPMMMLAGCSKPSDSAKSEGGKSAGDKDSKSGDQASGRPAAQKFDNGRAVLEAMAHAYRTAKTYHDRGAVHMAVQSRDQKPNDTQKPFAVSFERPNKLAMDVYAAKVRCDGKKFRARLKDLRGQVLERDAPAEMDIKTIALDPLLAQTLGMGPARGAPQPFLLLEDNGLDTLLKGADEPVLLAEPGEIDGHRCYRVQVNDPYGVSTFLIDQDTLVLRRIYLPTEELRAEIERQSGGPVESISLEADFLGAELNRPIDPKAFMLDMPKTPYQSVRYFMPHPGEWVGKKAPEFKFTDLAGDTITPQTLAGKAAALIFWSGSFPNSELNLLDFQKLFDAYKANAKVAVCVICSDDNADPKALADYCRSKNITMPIYRNLEQADPELRNVDLPKLAYLVGPDGTVQDFEYDDKTNFSAALPPRIDGLLNGQNVAAQASERYRKDRENYEREMDARVSGKAPAAPQAKIAERAEPKTFKLRQLWKCADVKNPGNMLVIAEPKRAPRLLVASPPNLVAEVGLDGKVAAVHQLNLAAEELVMNLRAFTTANGKTYVAGFTGGQQRLHLFNLSDRNTVVYPPDALRNPHSGLADVELFDLDGDGTPEIYVGYWGVVGVHCVALDGKQLWVNLRAGERRPHGRRAGRPQDRQPRSDLLEYPFRGGVAIGGARRATPPAGRNYHRQTQHRQYSRRRSLGRRQSRLVRARRGGRKTTLSRAGLQPARQGTVEPENSQRTANAAHRADHPRPPFPQRTGPMAAAAARRLDPDR